MMKEKMLIIDDSKFVRSSLIEIFENQYCILEAEDGYKAMDILREQCDDIFLVLLDIVMPKKNGFEVLQEIESDPKLRSIPVIIITGLDGFEEEIRALDLGAMDVITKPFEPRVVKKRAENALNRKALKVTVEKNRMLERQRIDEERYKIIVKQTGMCVFEWNNITGDFYASEELKQFCFGSRRGRELIFDWDLDNDIHHSEHDVFRRFLNRVVKGERQSDVTARFRRRDASFLWCKLAMTCFINGAGEVQRVVGTLANIDEMIRNQNELHYWAEYDYLTGIHNKNAFERLAQRMLKEDLANDYAVLCANVKHFKLVRDVYGVELSNRLLVHIAAALRKQVGSMGVCARNHDDVFYICMPYETKEDLIDFVKRVEETAKIMELNIKAPLTFGICLVDQRNTPVSLLADWANFAERSARDNASAVQNWAFYDEQIRADQMEEREIETEMQEALESGQFVVYLQAKHDIFTGKVVGAESLVRWNHPQKGCISPGKFIPIFESNGFIISLDEYVWECTCKILQHWREEKLSDIPISVNVSRVHVYSGNFEQCLISLAEKYEIPNQMLELELTESTFVKEPNELFKIMSRMSRNGFRFAMDDFGSGYSSLNMLKDAPLQVIKFDRKFLNDNSDNKNGETIIKHLMYMAKELNMSVVAEGVETAEQVDMLKRSGCRVVQGYYFSKPMTVENFERFAFDCTSDES